VEKIWSIDFHYFKFSEKIRLERIGSGQGTGTKAAIAIDNAKLYKESQEAIKSRDEFLSIASHELKTPLASLLLQNQMLQRKSKPELTTEYLDKAMKLSDRQLERLTGLVDDLLMSQKFVPEN